MSRPQVPIDEPQLTPQEQNKLRISVEGKEVGPQARTATERQYQDPAERNNPVSDFDLEHVPFDVLRQMRHDYMIAFALHLIDTTITRAEFHVEAHDSDGPNAQVAAFLESAWRRVHVRYFMAILLKLRWGHQPLVKRFVLANPGGSYFDPVDGTVKPVWSEGAVEPIILKAPIIVPPWDAVPKWVEKTGEFNGFDIENEDTGSAKAGGGGGKDKPDIDVYHALWTTNERETSQNGLYGYPRIARALPVWRSFWFNWLNRDRAMERYSVPPIKARFPPSERKIRDNRGELIDENQEAALAAANSIRNNANVAIPSTLVDTFSERGSNMPSWDFEVMQMPTVNLEQFDALFTGLNIEKMRAVFIPEQAAIQGGTGNSLNTARTMIESFNSAQESLWEDCADEVNKLIFPQLLQLNFPEFYANNGVAYLVSNGFTSFDEDIFRQLVQLFGQADPGSLNVDTRELMRRSGVPLKSPEEMERERQEIEAAQQAGPPLVAPGADSVGTAAGAGITATPGQGAGASVAEPNQAGSVTGFENGRIHVQPREVIYLASDDFAARLPQTDHYQDEALRALTLQFRQLWREHLSFLYEDAFAAVEDAIATSEADLQLDAGDDRAKSLIAAWKPSATHLADIAVRTANIFGRVLRRTSELQRQRTRLEQNLAEDEIEAWIQENVGRLLTQTEDTTREQIRVWLAGQIRLGSSDQEISRGLRQHFAENFPEYRADMVARSEVRDAYNASTLLTGRANGVRYARASDGSEHDSTCESRDGRLFTIREAMNVKSTQTGCLAWQLVPRANLSIEVGGMPEGHEDDPGWFDDATSTLYLSDEASVDERGEMTDVLVDYLIGQT
jgi:hypothetical protein